jgi:DNA-binding IclR family transcriptional regulator
MRRLSSENGVTAALAVVEDGSLRYVGATTPDGGEDERSLGPVEHLHAASAGKALLAWTGPEHVRRLGPLEPLTESSITDPEALLEQLEEVRSIGYAASRGEWDAGSWGVSAPVFGAASQPVAFVTLWGPLDQQATERIDSFGRMAQETAKALSAH